jgi:hypothetical protein
VIERRTIDVETLVQRALSMGSTSPAHLGENMPAMVAELSAALADVREEVVETAALVAWRPRDAAGRDDWVPGGSGLAYGRMNDA